MPCLHARCVGYGDADRKRVREIGDLIGSLLGQGAALPGRELEAGPDLGRVG